MKKYLYIRIEFFILMGLILIINMRIKYYIILIVIYTRVLWYIHMF